MNATLNFNRIGLLIQRFFIQRFSNELMFWGITIIVMMLIRNNIAGILGFAIIASIIRTNQLFREMHSPTNQINYFMIPATQIEKFTASLLYAFVYFWVMAISAYAIGNVLGTFVNNLLANFGLLSDVFNIRHSSLHWVLFQSIGNGNVKDFFSVFLAMIIIQSTFLLGSIYFKRSQILKTCLALVVFGFFFVIISIFLMKTFIVDGSNIHSYTIRGGLDLHINGTDFGPIKIISNIFFYLLTPYLWFTSYIRLTEKEV